MLPMELPPVAHWPGGAVCGIHARRSSLVTSDDSDEPDEPGVGGSSAGRGPAVHSLFKSLKSGYMY
jgi:hypothetical protein